MESMRSISDSELQRGRMAAFMHGAPPSQPLDLMDHLGLIQLAKLCVFLSYVFWQEPVLESLEPEEGRGSL